MIWKGFIFNKCRDYTKKFVFLQPVLGPLPAYFQLLDCIRNP